MKTKYQTDKAELENKILDANGLAKKLDYNTKIREIENKIPSISGLATKAAWTAVENKILDISSLVKETDYDTKITEIEKKLIDHNHDNYITIPDFYKLTAQNFTARLAHANLVRKTDFDEKLKTLKKKLPQTKQSICSLKINLKNYKHLIQVILEVKVILKKMALKII